MKQNSAQKMSRTSQWWLNHLRACFFAAGQLLRTPLASLTTIAVIAIAMMLPAGLFILVNNLQNLNQHWNGKPQISLYLNQQSTDQTAEQLAAQLRNNPQIASVKYISPSDGLKQFSHIGQFKSFIQTLPDNPLPGVLVITPKINIENEAALQQLFDQLKTLPQVSVGQLDLQWIHRLHTMLIIGQRIVYTLALLFSLGVLLIVGNTIRLATQRHRAEINVLRLLGASPSFIRRPLLYRGLFYGLLGGILAWVFLTFLLWWIESPAQALASSYHLQLAVDKIQWRPGIMVILTCAALGWCGAFMALTKHLNAPEEI